MRIRDLGVVPGRLPTGPLNAITDVPGVKVGHVTLIEGEGTLVPGRGPVRTGVTAVLPHGGNLFRKKVAAATRTFNGFGKCAGFEQVRELGTLEVPIILTNTLNVGLAVDAVIAYMLRQNPEIGVTTGSLNVVVGETNDGYLNDIQGRHVREQHVWQAIETASGGPVAEGVVGAGTGTGCFGFKGGIGTASRRVLIGQFNVGALVQTNFGSRPDLMVLGVRAGLRLLTDDLARTGPGSIMMIIATDAPLDARQLGRLAMRAAFGLARTGAVCHHGSGDFGIAFSTATRFAHFSDALIAESGSFRDEHLDDLFLGVVESVEEAILNSLVAATTLTGRDGHTLYAIPADKLKELLRKEGQF